MRQFSWCAVGLYIYSNTWELPRVTDLVIEREVQILNFLYGPSVMVQYSGEARLNELLNVITCSSLRDQAN